MRHFVLTLFVLALIAANDAAVWVSSVTAACAGTCPFCP